LLFDDPVEKAAYYARQGGLYFDVQPENTDGCKRWIRLFGIEPEDWPRQSLYKLATVLPRLHSLAGSEAGLRLGLKLLLEVDVMALHGYRQRTPLASHQLSRLGARASRLDVDLIVGEGLEDEAAVEITLGPVSLAMYDAYQTEAGERRLHQVLHLLLPYHLQYAVRWFVGERHCAPRLGIGEKNAVLGVNTHLGRR
jgi:predicted component of type VI protein secretion system